MQQEPQTPNKVQLITIGLLLFGAMLYVGSVLLGIRNFMGVMVCLLAYEIYKNS